MGSMLRRTRRDRVVRHRGRGAVAAVVAVTLVAGATVLGLAASSHGSETCGTAIDADADGFASATAAGDALRAALVDVHGADLTGCDEWRVDLAGTFALTASLVWTRTEALVLAGPVAADGPPARLEAVADPAVGDVEHRLLTAVAGMAGPVGPVTVERMVLTGGAVDGVGQSGGAVLADVVVLVDSEVSGSTAAGGGGVAARAVRAERTSVVGNGAVFGAALGGAILATEEVTLVNVTLAGNVAAQGGAVWLPAAGTLDATFVTFRGNSVTEAGAGADLHRGASAPGAGSGSVVLRGVLLGGVAEGSAGPSCGGAALPAVGAGLAVDGSFVADPADTSCGAVPRLDVPLAFTTVPFLPGTTALPVPDGGPAAIAAVACDAGWPAVDQRGVTRPVGDTCDAGAVERSVAAGPPDPEGTDRGAGAGAGAGDAGDVVVGGPVPTSVPAGDGACAGGACADGPGPGTFSRR